MTKEQIEAIFDNIISRMEWMLEDKAPKDLWGEGYRAAILHSITVVKEERDSQARLINATQ